MTLRKYYAVAELPYSRLCVEDRLQVYAFSSRVGRDQWVSEEVGESRALRTYGEQRRAVNRSEAASAMAELMGGHGRECLREILVDDAPRDWDRRSA